MNSVYSTVATHLPEGYTAHNAITVRTIVQVRSTRLQTR